MAKETRIYVITEDQFENCNVNSVGQLHPPKGGCLSKG